MSREIGGQSEALQNYVACPNVLILRQDVPTPETVLRGSAPELKASRHRILPDLLVSFNAAICLAWVCV